jgi:cytoskeletal protein CcmA (bactofilin family)
MFSKSKKEMQTVEVNNSSNIIGKGTTLEGNLTTAGNIRIEGKLIGAVNTKAKLVLGTTSWVKGNIVAQNAEVAGEVHGTIEITGLLILKPTAVIQGDIITNKLVFEEGAKFNGKCKMDTIEQSANTKDTSSWKSNGGFFGKKTELQPVENVTKEQQQASS